MALAVAGICMPASAQDMQLNPITQAMLEGYAELLEQNPDDWFTLYERASQYYRLSNYDKALSDILHAISCTPAKERDQLAAEHSLAADICTQTGDYAGALRHADAALEATPGSYPLLYMKGNICLYMKDYAGARSCFQSMQRLKSRSQESLFGLAKCAIAEGNTEEARTYMEQAEKLDPSNYITYCRLGDLCADMDDNQMAAAHYISAFSLNSGDDRPLGSILSLGKKDYQATVEAIDYALSKTSNVVPLLFIKGNIAKATGHTSDAYDAYTGLMRTSEGASPEVLATMAGICLDSNSLTEALGYADRALSISPSIRNMTLKASVEYALRSYDSALALAGRALADDSDNADAALIAAESLIAIKDYNKAVQMLDAGLTANPNELRLLLLRGYLGINGLLDGTVSTADMQRASRLPVSDDADSIGKAIAQYFAGKELDAYSTLQPVLDKADTDATAAYLAAVYYAQTGNVESGRKFLEKARVLGFDNKYLLETFDAPMMSVAPLR